MKIINVVGARPNFMKIAPLIEALDRYPGEFEHRLVHTGQHYDERMSRAFFDDLGIPRPDIDLGVGSGSHAEQTARVMLAFEPVCRSLAPDLVVVVGDVNSTLACAITARKLGIRVAHVEAGLRSRDIGMPEEINRLCTDVLCDLLFTTDELASDNLRREGIGDERIFFVGNVMIDTLLKHREAAGRLPVIEQLGLPKRGYALVTLHRPSNVDEPAVLDGILSALSRIGERLPVVFPVHPRTRERMAAIGRSVPAALRLLAPLGYLEFLHLTMNAALVLTDSGGLQEETTVLGVPCLTLRRNTERPITCSQGTNRLVGNDPDAIVEAALAVLDSPAPEPTVPALWDGRAAGRIVEVLRTQRRTFVLAGGGSPAGQRRVASDGG